MSARESIENLWDRATPVGPLLDAYAHELAELIRSIPGPDDPDDYGGFVSMGADWAADLIDPKVQPKERRCDMREAHTWHRWTKDGVTYVCKSVVLNSGN